ncbi:MAG: MFS transporter [Thermoanaerobaculia bacterium]|nr:MFS transporter [Thermoanaerobaculia bacterium]
MEGRSFGTKLGILWTLYFVQGLPFGFQATALPVYLREVGVSLTGIGFATALALPWSLKLFWAPLVDRFPSEHAARRRSWILPLQILLALSCLASAWVPPSRGLAILLVLVFLMNLFAATLDVAVDGLAVDLLSEAELGPGNIAQVVGYKIGMLTGGGILVWASGRIGWEGLFGAMGVLIALSLLMTVSFREQTLVRDPSGGPRPVSVSGILRALGRALRSRRAVWLLLFVGTYKLGETMADTMFKPFLFDAGFSREQIGLWVGTWGMLFSISGSVAGGWLASRMPLLRAAAVTATLRVLPVAGEWWLSLVEPTTIRVVLVTAGEHFFGGALTTAMFAFMMSSVDRRISATHYTLLASVEVWGKLPAAWVSGLVTQTTSYPFLFGLATVLSVAFLGLLWPLAKARPGVGSPRATVGAADPIRDSRPTAGRRSPETTHPRPPTGGRP